MDASRRRVGLSVLRRRIGERLGRLVFGNRLYRLTLRGAAAELTDAAPQPLWPGRHEDGEAFLNGQFRHGGRTHDFHEAPWLAPLGPRAQAGAHGFGWLRDLAAVGDMTALGRGRELAQGWAAQHDSWDPLAWRVDVLGRRLTHWILYRELVVAPDGDPGRTVVLSSLGAQARHLGRAVGRRQEIPLEALQGALLCGLALPGHEAMLAPALARLEHELARRIVADGGHAGRSPSRHLAVLRLLVETRSWLLGGHHEVPQALQGAIDRMVPLLRTFRHGDGALALFNDGWEEDPADVEALLAHADVKGKPLSAAPHSGFHRLAAKKALVLVDTGAPPNSAGGHAGTLSFEFSLGKERLVVNCGSHLADDARLREALRRTAAHSTLAVGDADSARFVPDGGLLRGPAKVTAVRREEGGSVWLDASHDGYRDRFGVIHHRRIYLAASGEDLRGEDQLVGTDHHPFALRFHLHPSVQASVIQDGTAVLLRLPSGSGWRFRVEGGLPVLEDSLYLGRPGSPRHNEQIVIHGRLEGQTATLKWALRREA